MCISCTSKHLVKFYQELLKSKGKNVETNFVQDNFINGQEYITPLDVTGFLGPP